MAEQKIGVVTHYFGKIGVAAVKITEGELKAGDTIHVKGHTSDFTQQVEVMQIDRKPIDSAGTGDEVGIKVNEPARGNDEVFKVTPD